MLRWSLLPPGLRLRCTPACTRRWLSSSQKVAAEGAQNTWGNTLLLPKTTFPLYNDPSKDPKLQDKTTQSLYRWQWEHAQGPLFVFHDGPPYANGDLHMGHALNKILKDIINRYHVSLGHKVNYMPGWDCHGLPIENKVLKQLGVEINQLTPSQIRDEAEKFARSEVASQMEQFRQLGVMADWSPETTYRTLDPEYELRQLDIFKTMVEKGLIYRQHRPVHYSPSSRSALAEAELVYNDKHVSHSVYVSFRLDPTSPHMSDTLRALTAGREKVNLLVWTTTPWTLTANMAIAVNPEMRYKIVSVKEDSGSSPEGNAHESVVIYVADREDSLKEIQGLFPTPAVLLGELDGSALVGATYRPIFAPLHRSSSSLPSLPIIPSSHVTRDSGTGLVHCAPAHGAEDYAVMQSLGLIKTNSSSASESAASTPSAATDLVCHVNGLGQFTEDVADVVGKEAAGRLVAKDVLDQGGREIVGLLTEIGALRKVQRFKHRYPYDWKTDKPVIVLATSQWFANLDNIKEDAIAALQDVSFVPSISRNRLESFIRSRSEWCISRQRVWGVPIPALYHLPSNTAVLDSDSLTHIMSVLREHGPRYWWDGPASAFVPPSRREGLSDAQLDEVWRKGTDTMDVWFDSGTSWSLLDSLYRDPAASVQDAKERQRTFGADVCLEGSDQHRGWFQSQLLTAIGSATTPERARAAPYSTLITHGMVLDETGKKMSKSLGNIVSPMTVIHGGKGKSEKAYGPDVLRLWAATVEFGKDMSIGPTMLQQCAETMRKIRNSSRFILGSLGDRPYANKVERADLGLAERYVLHRLHRLDRVAREGYEAFDFPQVINELSYFANITLSSFYFDINKDCLYAEREDSIQRRRVLTVLDQVLTTMTKVLAPVLPHLAEEIHATLHGPDAPSVFTEPWTALPEEFVDVQAEADMNKLLHIRSKVFVLLEQARKDGVVKSSLSADVAMSISSAATSDVIDLLGREETTLKALFGVSGVSLCDRSIEETTPAWQYKDTLDIEGTEIQLAVRPAALHKCPRCWTYTRHEHDELCKRCADVVRS
ncbi:isoleucyl-tRNA synthetase [Trametes coccinea BRFM310]|uniref:Isoleucine--tRNA ligase, mitochondrial n=1 Tax=Trametes coccinea (strain BRFM310) TaxID=1353009 RepID=A0A1Y2J7G8_TRAC3|nr:isoleucyl-tRNA synthetase [Trametes coccinea BRFM310]